MSAFEKSLTANGNLVELWARKLFPDGVLVSEFSESANKITSEYISSKKSIIFQATFIYDQFLVRNDVLEYDASNNCWNLYEIKGTNTMDENSEEIDHVEDATFQYIVLLDSGINVGRVCVIHLNKEYVRGKELDVEKLFIKEDITEQVISRLETTREKMANAAIALL